MDRKSVEPWSPRTLRKSGLEIKSPDEREILIFLPDLATSARWNGPRQRQRHEKIYDNRNGFYWVHSRWARRCNFQSKKVLSVISKVNQGKEHGDLSDRL